MKTFTRLLLIFLCGLTTSPLWGQGGLIGTNQTSGCAPLTVSFTDQSMASPTAWLWDFGDGNSSTLQNPTHTYTTGGAYRVTFVVTLTGGNNMIDTLQILVEEPRILWANSQTAICGPGTYTFDAFTNQSGVWSNLQWILTDPSGNSTTTNTTSISASLSFPIAGLYQLQVSGTTQQGCTSNIFTTNIPINAPISIQPTVYDASCGLMDGAIKVTTSGGTPPVFLFWSNGAIGDSISQLSPGTYTVIATDTLGCEARDTITVGTQGTLDFSAAVTDVSCEGDTTGAIDLTINASAPPVSYQWSTGATTQDLQGIGTGTYTVSVTDANCTVTETYTIDADLLDITFSPAAPNCNGVNGGLTALVSGGVPPYQYVWNTGSTSPSLSNINAGGYSVTVTDSTGCSDHEATILNANDSCFFQISGRIFIDANQNCQYDPGETPIQGWVRVNGAFWTYATQQGMYTVSRRPGSYILSANINNSAYYSTPCLTNGLVPVNLIGSHVTHADFPLQVDSSFIDLTTYITTWAQRPGFTNTHRVYAVNNGTVPMNALLTFQHDPIIEFISATPTQANYIPTSRQLTWNVNNLFPNQSVPHTVLDSIARTVPLGTILHNNATLFPTANDVNPADNVDSLSHTVVGAYDPNDKQVFPAGIGPNGEISSEEVWLTYTIRFQNTGTDTAFYVVLRDTIDQNLDLQTIRPLSASHDYAVRVEDQTLIVSFDNILLPDSFVNEPASNGYFTFLIRQNQGLVPGDRMENRAAIFFDFNEPIITNTVVNTIASPTHIRMPIEDGLGLYPNPTQDIITLYPVQIPIEQVEVFSTTGQRLRVVEGQALAPLPISLSDLQTGVYLLRIHTDAGILTRKITKQ